MKKVITFIMILLIVIVVSGCSKSKPTDISDKAYKSAVAYLDTTRLYYDGVTPASGTLLTSEDEYNSFMDSSDGSGTYTELMFKIMYMKKAIKNDHLNDFKKMYDECKEILAIE